MGLGFFDFFVIAFIAGLCAALIVRRSRWLRDPNFPDEPYSRLYDRLARKEIIKLRKELDDIKRELEEMKRKE